MKTETAQTAEERAMEMFTRINFGDLPQRAQDYTKYLCRKYGGCGEVFLTAFAHYAQFVEGLPCHDELYRINEDGENWFYANP